MRRWSKAGMKVVETDLGEYIIQLAGEPPSHLIAPVIHRRVEDIADVFQRELDMPPTLDPQVICGVARSTLRKEFLSADMGISGCNFGDRRDRHLLHRHQRRQRPHDVDLAARLCGCHGH